MSKSATVPDRLEIADRTSAPLRSALRVCFLIDRLRNGGTESQLLSLIRHLDRGRITPYLCLLDGHDAESRALEPCACPVLRLGVRSLLRPATLGAALRLARFLRRQRVDIVQVYFPDSTYFGVPVARLAGVRTVVRSRFNLGYWITARDRWLGRAVSGLVAATVTNCETCRQTVVSGEWADPASVHVIENGLERAAFAELPPPLLSANGCRRRRVGLVANLRPVKDPPLLVQAAARLVRAVPDVDFHIAGDGELRPELQRQIDELGLAERVFLRGQIEDIPGFLAEIDFAVLCSRSEGLANALLEYMAAGRPIVATAVGATPHLIVDGIHGLLVPPGDSERLATALQRLLQEPALAARLALAARARIGERHDARWRARRYQGLYQHLTATARPNWRWETRC